MTGTEFTAAKLANVDQAAADPRLSHLDFRLLWLWASAADRKTGVARRKQIDLAQMLGIHRRTVQRCRDRLVSFGYLDPIGQKPGGYVSSYNILASKKAAPVSPSEKGGAGVTSKGGIPVQKGGAGVQKGGPPTAHDPLISLDIPCAHAREPSCPDGLGPLGDALRQRMDPAKFEAWFGKGEAAVVDHTAQVVTIAVRSRFFAEQIRNRFEADILECLPGVLGIRFEVRDVTAAEARTAS